MSSKRLAYATMLNLVWFVLPALAQDQTDTDKQAFLVAEKFASEFLVEREAAKALKSTAVPFVEIVQGNEERPTVIQKSEDVEKRIQTVIKDHKKLGIHSSVTIKRSSAATDYDIFDLLSKIPNDVFNKQADRVFITKFSQKDAGFPFVLLTLVRSHNE